MPRALVSGFSVAGPVLAHELLAAGWEVEVVEAAPAPRAGGQAIDVRGAALEVMRRLGLAAPLHAARTRLGGMSLLGADGVEQWRSTAETLTGGRFDAGDVEILKDELSALLAAAVPADRVRYGEAIATLVPEQEAVAVTFRSGRAARYDLVVGADGLGSPVRQQAFAADADCVHPVGQHLAYFSAPNLLDLRDWQIVYRGTEERGCVVYPTRDNRELRVCFGFPACAGPARGDGRAQVAARCAGMGWRTGELIEAMRRAPDFYAGPMAQVRLPRWHAGRVALVGDAGYCPSPLTGQGTSLAIVGAYVLAQEIGAGADLPAALARYDRRLRPFVAANQAILGAADAAARIDAAKHAIAL